MSGVNPGFPHKHQSQLDLNSPAIFLGSPEMESVSQLTFSNAAWSPCFSSATEPPTAISWAGRSFCRTPGVLDFWIIFWFPIITPSLWGKQWKIFHVAWVVCWVTLIKGFPAPSPCSEVWGMVSPLHESSWNLPCYIYATYRTVQSPVQTAFCKVCWILINGCLQHGSNGRITGICKDWVTFSPLRIVWRIFFLLRDFSKGS